MAIYNLIPKKERIKPYHVYRALILDKPLTKLLFSDIPDLPRSMWKLSWDDLSHLRARNGPGTEMMLLDLIFVEKFGSTLKFIEIIEEIRTCMTKTNDSVDFCAFCWRIVSKGQKRPYLCSLHSRGGEDYLKGKRLKNKFEIAFEEMTLPGFFKFESYPASVFNSERAVHSPPKVIITKCPNVKEFLLKRGMRLDDNENFNEVKIIEIMNAPEPFNIAGHLGAYKQLSLMLVRAEALLSLLRDDGKAKGWGGARKGSGRPRKFLSPSCHPERGELAEIEGDRAN